MRVLLRPDHRIAATVTGIRRLIIQIFVTHLPNIRQAFPKLADGLADGDALIFGPDGMNGGSTFVARIKIEEWPELR